MARAHMPMFTASCGRTRIIVGPPPSGGLVLSVPAPTIAAGYSTARSARQSIARAETDALAETLRLQIRLQLGATALIARWSRMREDRRSRTMPEPRRILDDAVAFKLLDGRPVSHSRRHGSGSPRNPSALRPLCLRSFVLIAPAQSRVSMRRRHEPAKMTSRGQPVLRPSRRSDLAGAGTRPQPVDPKLRSRLPTWMPSGLPRGRITRENGKAPTARATRAFRNSIDPSSS